MPHKSNKDNKKKPKNEANTKNKKNISIVKKKRNGTNNTVSINLALFNKVLLSTEKAAAILESENH